MISALLLISPEVGLVLDVCKISTDGSFFENILGLAIVISLDVLFVSVWLIFSSVSSAEFVTCFLASARCWNDRVSSSFGKKQVTNSADETEEKISQTD